MASIFPLASVHTGGTYKLPSDIKGRSLLVASRNPRGYMYPYVHRAICTPDVADLLHFIPCQQQGWAPQQPPQPPAHCSHWQQWELALPGGQQRHKSLQGIRDQGSVSWLLINSGGVDVGMLLENAGFTAAPSEAAQEQKFSSQPRLDEEFEAGTSNWLIDKMEKLPRKTSLKKGPPICNPWRTGLFLLLLDEAY